MKTVKNDIKEALKEAENLTQRDVKRLKQINSDQKIFARSKTEKEIKLPEDTFSPEIFEKLIIEAEVHIDNELFYKYLINRNDLSSREVEKIEEHLLNCEQCTTDLKQLKLTYGE